MGRMTDVITPAIERRRARMARALGLHDEVLLIGAGEPIPLPEGTDQTYPFRAHSEYFYLVGMECPGAVLAFDPRLGPRRASRLRSRRRARRRRAHARAKCDGIDGSRRCRLGVVR